MTEKYTHILAIVDRSGSMYASAERMTEALNEYFMSQDIEGQRCFVDYVQFDTDIETVFEDTKASRARARIEPRGGTALLDAVGKSVNTFKAKNKKTAKIHRPDDILVVIVTDGYENASKEYTYADIQKLVKKLENKNWKFVFLGANIDAEKFGGKLGIDRESSLTFNIHNNNAVNATTSALSTYSTTYRATGSAEFTEEDRKFVVETLASVKRA